MKEKITNSLKVVSAKAHQGLLYLNNLFFLVHWVKLFCMVVPSRESRKLPTATFQHCFSMGSVLKHRLPISRLYGAIAPSVVSCCCHGTCGGLRYTA